METDRRMATSGRGTEHGPLSPRAARAKLAKASGKLKIYEEKATPLVLDDREEDAQEKWMLAEKVLHRHTFHIQTISSALRPAWGNPKGLLSRSVGDNAFVVEFTS